jgi:hypothetical protein
MELQCSRRCDASTAVRVIHVGRLARSCDKDNAQAELHALDYQDYLHMHALHVSKAPRLQQQT